MKEIKPTLSPEHLADLHKSGLLDETIEQAGLYSVCPSEIQRVLGFDSPELESLLAFPYPGCNGFTRFKLFPSLETKGGGTMRYFQEKGSGLHIYFPPGFDHSAEVIRISEGEKKSLEGTQEGLNVCGLGGIWNFALRDNNGNPQLIEDFQRLDFRSVRSIEIIPDGDFKQKEGVRHAVYRLAYLLGGEFYNKKGYESLSEAVDCIRVVELPLYFKLDDFLCEYGVRAFEGLPRITVADRIFDDIREKERKEVTRIDLQDSLIGLKTLLTMDIPGRPRLFLWLPQGGLAMVYGPRGIGKTYFSLSLAVSLATGKSFLRWAAPPETGVLLVDGEMLISDLRERLVNLLPHEPAKPISLLSGEQVFMKIDRDLNFADLEFQAAVIGLLEANPELRVVVVDNISCLFMGLKESDKNDWEKVIPWLLTLRRRGISVVLIHHSGKSGDQRGTSGREDMLDSVIRLESVPGNQNEGARFIVRFTKCRGAYGKDIEPFETVLDLNNPEAWTWKPLEESNFERMIELAKDGVDTVNDMANELGISKGMVSRLKKQGVKKGMLKDGRKIIPIEG